MGRVGFWSDVGYLSLLSVLEGGEAPPGTDERRDESSSRAECAGVSYIPFCS
jgi:hypothetical protein